MTAHIQKSLAAKLAPPLLERENAPASEMILISHSRETQLELCAREKTYFQCAHGDDECRLGCNLEIIPSMLGVCSARVVIWAVFAQDAHVNSVIPETLSLLTPTP
jgi:hypothetical protein